jgi:hypothetical protein
MRSTWGSRRYKSLMDDCPECINLLLRGRSKTTDPVHCGKCHKTWTGNEAQHCVTCHFTFTTIAAADAHRYPDWSDHVDPSITEGWREIRPGVYTNAKPLSEEARARMREVQHDRSAPPG